MSSSNANGTISSPAQPNGTPRSSTNLGDDIASIANRLAEDIPEDAADQDIAAVLRRLEQASALGQDVEGRLDALLEQLDGLLGELQPSGGGHAAGQAQDATAKREGS